MKHSLSDWGSIAAIFAIPIMLFTWWFNRERFGLYLKKHSKKVISFFLLIILIGLYHFIGIDWILYRVPIWIIIIFFFIMFVLIYIISLSAKQAPREGYFELYGARWTFTDGGNFFFKTPICAKCLMEMIRISRPLDGLNQFQDWQCRECSHVIEWDAGLKGDLLSDVQARYLATVRKGQMKP